MGADAVCCDPNFKPYAEPQHFFAQPGRSFADFKADTTEHGWPSFRREEIIEANVKVDNTTGEVVSKCGTHLGSYLPDAKGPRYCLDLSCLSGHGRKQEAFLQELELDRPVEPLADEVTLFKISGEECGQATLDKKYESYAIKFAGLKEGTCASVGFTVADGTKVIKVPVLGQITIGKYKKPS